MLNGKMIWKLLQTNASVVSAVAITLGLIVACYQVLQIRAVSRSESALSYCSLYLSNKTINDFASETSNFSAWAKEEYGITNIFQEDIPYNKVNQNRKDIDATALAKKFEEHVRSFGQLANYFDYAIDGVDRKVFDGSVIRDCLASQIVCFREKYHVRLGVFDELKMMEKWREFIAKGKRDAKKYCRLATREAW